ncbi:MAG TPA: hypothetical protein VE692_02070, partial [Nitrososphaera sp.]|nr:hypothetical protein [Nitrososphaera sp.]
LRMTVSLFLYLFLKDICRGLDLSFDLQHAALSLQRESRERCCVAAKPFSGQTVKLSRFFSNSLYIVHEHDDRYKISFQKSVGEQGYALFITRYQANMMQ